MKTMFYDNDYSYFTYDTFINESLFFKASLIIKNIVSVSTEVVTQGVQSSQCYVKYNES